MAPPRKPKLRTVLLIGGALGLAGAALVAGANAWVLTSGGEIFEAPPSVPPRTVAIVPGARVLRDGTPMPALEDRLLAALALWRAGTVKRILVSGDHGTTGYDEVNGMQRWLVERGVPTEAIFLDHAGLRTLDTMARAASVFQVRDAVVCTQRFHLPRALFLARHHGIDAVGLVADRREYVDARRDALREVVARTRAAADVVLGVGPRHLGDPIPIDGSASASHDRWSQR
ncbi:MAG: hypothetical protein AMXMBFR64_20560 [Myxococcales bacterium]